MENQDIEPSNEPKLESKTIYNSYFGYLVGQVREVLEASISDSRQLKALKGVMDDVMYRWWDKTENKDLLPSGIIIEPGKPREWKEKELQVR